MSDRFRFDLAPDEGFADRLEADLLRAIQHSQVLPTDKSNQFTNNEENTVTIELDSADRKPPRRTFGLIAAAAAAALVIGGVAWVTTRNTDDATPADTTPETIAVGSPVTFTVGWAYSDIISECIGGKACLNRFDIPASAEFAGDVSGVGNQVVLWNAPADYPGLQVDHLEHVVMYNVAADVAGCGSGDFMLVEIMQFVSGADRDRDTGTYKGTWQIVPESGRRGLASITGSGTSTGVFGTAQHVGRTFQGSVDCP